MHKTLTLIAVALLLALAGCAGLRLDAQADAQGRAAFQALQRGDWRALAPLLSPVIAQDPELRPRLEKVRRIVPLQAPSEVRVMNWQSSGLWGAADAHTTSITYLYTFDTQSLMVNVVFDRRGGGASVAGLHVAPVSPALIQAHRFDAPGKSLRHYGFLALCVFTALLMVTASALALLTPQLEVRWLWALVAFAGVGAIWMNWTTGAVGAELATHLVALGADRSLPPITPWILRTSVPVGAVIVLVRVWMVRRARGGSPRT